MGYNYRYHRRAKVERLESSWDKVPQEVFAKLGVSTAALHAIDAQMDGHIVLPGMDDYSDARMGKGMSPFDKASPLIVFMCNDVHDVWVAMKACHDFDWPFVARSGRHSTAAFSSDCQSVIDVGGLNDISVIGGNKVSVGPGCNFGKLNRFMKLHKLHIPTGNCDDVCTGGYVQGGGYGYTSRQHGMQLDTVTEYLVMLADGQMVTASATVNPDLFWAMRGGTGNNFGIVVNIVYQAVPMEEIWGFVITWGPEDAAQVMQVAQDAYAPYSGLEIGYTGNITTIEVDPETKARKPVYMFGGLCIQGRDVGMKALEPILNIGSPNWMLDEMGYYYDLNDAVEGKLPGPPPTPGMHEIKSSGYLAKAMPLEAWEDFFNYYVENIEKTNPYNLIVLEAYGGAINDVPASATAFIHRDTYMDIYIDAFWSEQPGLGSYDDAQTWMDGINEVLAPHLNGHYYQNYPQRDMPNFRWQYWGDAFNGLLFVKNKFDPDNVFHYEQSISPYPNDPRIQKSEVPSQWQDPTITYNGMTPSFKGMAPFGDT